MTAKEFGIIAGTVFLVGLGAGLLTRSECGGSLDLKNLVLNLQPCPTPAPPPANGGSDTRPAQVFIPSDVKSIYVHYQDRQNQSPGGCTRPPDADGPIPPDVLVAKMGQFLDYARANNKALILTADSSRGWDVAAREIRINGKELKGSAPYWCKDRQRYYGYEVATQ